MKWCSWEVTWAACSGCVLALMMACGTEASSGARSTATEADATPDSMVSGGASGTSGTGGAQGGAGSANTGSASGNQGDARAADGGAVSGSSDAGEIRRDAGFADVTAEANADGGITGCSGTVDYIQGDFICDAHPIATYLPSDGENCVFPIDPSIDLYDVNDVALNCPPMLVDGSPDSLAWIISFQNRTLTLLSGCSALTATDAIVLYATENCVYSPP